VKRIWWRQLTDAQRRPTCEYDEESASVRRTTATKQKRASVETLFLTALSSSIPHHRNAPAQRTLIDHS